MNRIEGHWTVPQLAELLAGMGGPDALRTLDAAGLTPAIAAAIHSAVKTAMLMSLLDQAEAGGAESALTRIEVLLEENHALLRALLEANRAQVALLSTRAARQAQLDQARADEDREIEAAREEARALRKGRTRPAPTASAT